MNYYSSKSVFIFPLHLCNATSLPWETVETLMSLKLNKIMKIL